MQNFFSYQITVDDLPQAEQHYHLKADVEDLNKIKEILKVPSVKSFSSDIYLKFNQRQHLLKVWGTVDALLTLESVVSLELFDKEYNAEFELKYTIIY